ncbi:U-box domain-containing protein 33-like [Diospyros lotus]|uniref:U-box domain-containing protein 33-like n=1 Tax=Diospyros lotus TaxID=55363 RepID=UPI00224F3A44|nr:U-box domain-containing protein 33-like [Diospyros lotus]
MELLSPTHPPVRAGDSFSGFSPPASLRGGLERTATSQLPEIVEEGGDRIYVAVGRSVGKATALLRWTFRQFEGREICIVHVHRPSPLIPTLLGKLPASQACSEVVSAHRREEREQMRKLLLYYLGICCQSKVKSSILVTEASQIQSGIVDLVNEHHIRKLVMGAVPENCMKMKKSSSKASYATKYAPQYCEIWFINKGKHAWTREAFEGPSFVVSTTSQSETATADNLRFRSLQDHRSGLMIHPECLHSSSARSTLCDGTRKWMKSESVQTEVALTPTLPSSVNRSNPHYCNGSSSPTSSCSSSGYASSAEQRMSLESATNFDEESLHTQLIEVRIEAEASRDEAFQEFLKRKNLEAGAVEAIDKVKALESACAHEIQLRKEAEDALTMTIQEQEKLLEEREELTRELQKAMRNIALLDSHAQEAHHLQEEASGELKLIHASVAALQLEKQKIQWQKMEATCWLDRWKNRGQAGNANYIGLVGCTEYLPQLAEFSLADLQTATCNFSESFKIGQSGYGSVYKGEMLDKTVAIKKLHPRNMQQQSDFQQEVQVLGKLQHPHLVTLIGICPDAWSLVYEYMPNGSLQDCLFRRSNLCFLSWKIRAQIIAEISSALLFLHSRKPEKIVHGDLKPQNILLDSDLSCKISDFGICRIMSQDTLRCPSFRRYTEPKGAFSYTDPEFHRTGSLTPKSDIYSFGLIILQLLTGKSPVGLASEVRKAASCGKLATILDSSAGEWPNFVAKQLVDVGLQFCESSSRDRPELTPRLARELEQLRTIEEQPVPSFFLCPILQEIMHDPQVAADGFTYEGEALRGWFEGGRETSPMTNLKLDHLHLTPNHALRLAIQDWLCKS